MEGIIKSVTCDPVKLYTDAESNTKALVKIYFNAAALAAMYEAAGIDPEYVTATYIVKSEEFGWDTETINLKEAAETGHEISNAIDLRAARINIT